MRPNLVLAAGTLAGAMGALDGTVLNVAIPTIRDDLGANFAQVEWIMSAYSLVFAALMVLFGTLGDLYGHRGLMQWGVAVFVAGSVLAALSGSAEVLIAARLITGLGAAMQVPSHVAATVAVFPKERRGWALGIAIGGASVGLALGPIIGGLLVETVGWRWIFWINVPLGLLVVVLTALYVPGGAPAREGRPQLDLPGVALLIAALGGLIGGLVQSTVDGWDSGLVIGLLAGGVVASAGFVARELRAPAPLLDLRTFRDAAFGGGIAVGAILSFGLISVFLFVSIYYQSVRGLTAIETGLLYLPTTLLVIALAPVASKIADRLGPRRVVTAALLVAAAGLALFGPITPDTAIVQLLAGQLLIGAGVGLSLPLLSTAVINAVPAEHSGMASSVLKTSREVAGTFGVAAIGALVVAFGGAEAATDADAAARGIGDALFVGAGLIVVSAVVAWLTVQAPSSQPTGSRSAGQASPK